MSGATTGYTRYPYQDDPRIRAMAMRVKWTLMRWAYLAGDARRARDHAKYSEYAAHVTHHRARLAHIIDTIYIGAPYWRPRGQLQMFQEAS